MAVFGSEKLDAKKIKLDTTVFGITYPDPDVNINAKREKAVKVAYKDLDGEGKTDAVFTFKAAPAALYGFENVKRDLWFFAEAAGSKISGFDTVKITK